LERNDERNDLKRLEVINPKSERVDDELHESSPCMREPDKMEAASPTRLILWVIIH
jgi:hypothetical protein